MKHFFNNTEKKFRTQFKRLAKSNIEMKFPEFESLDDAVDESLFRQSKLKKQGKHSSLYLCDKLANCCDENPCKSGACPICVRNYRLSMISEVIKHYKDSSEWRTITLIYYVNDMTDEEFIEFSPKKIVGKLYKQLQRSGLNGSIVGGLEIDFHKDTQKWLPHLHLIVPYMPKELNKLRHVMKQPANMGTRATVTNRPMVTKEIKDIYKQISYLFKPVCMEIRPFISSQGKRRTKKHRLDDSRLVMSLLKLDELGFSKLCFQYGIRIPINMSTK